MGRSSEAKDRKNLKKVKCDGRMDGPTDGPTKRGVESRSTRLKKIAALDSFQLKRNRGTYSIYRQWTGRWTDKASYRVASPLLKKAEKRKGIGKERHWERKA